MKLLSLLALLMMSFTISQSSYAENCEAVNDSGRGAPVVSTTSDDVVVPDGEAGR